MDACPGPSPERGRQLVFAFAGSAQALKTLDERLRSRLESGLVVELLEPDLEVRLRYLQTLCRQRHLNFNREQLLFLAQRCAQFRLLQGLLLKVEAFAAMHGRNRLQRIWKTSCCTGGAERSSRAAGKYFVKWRADSIFGLKTFWAANDGRIWFLPARSPCTYADRSSDFPIRNWAGLLAAGITVRLFMPLKKLRNC